MRNAVIGFGEFRLEPGERRLSRLGQPVELSGRYLDALILLAGSAGQLITKDRFMAEAWRGIPVTDEALTQCIRTLRRTLGDDAAHPRFIETVPRYGYRFVAEVTTETRSTVAAADAAALVAEPSAASPHEKTTIPPVVPDAAPEAGSEAAATPASSPAAPTPGAPTVARTNEAAPGPDTAAQPAASAPALPTTSSTSAPMAAPDIASPNSASVSVQPTTPSTADRPAMPAATSSDLKDGSPFKLPQAASGWVTGGTILSLSAAGLAGGAAAGLVGGIGYGLLAATEPPAGTGAISIVLVLTCLCVIVGLLGGLGVGMGIAVARALQPSRLFPLMLGGALGGLVVGALGRLIGLDAFALLVGSRPAAITGGSEGMLIGALAGTAAWLALRRPDPPGRAAISGAALGALAGLSVALGGGQMMAGSLAVLAAAHPEAPLGTLLGNLPGWLRLASSAVEGATFVGALTLAFALVARSERPRS